MELWIATNNQHKKEELQAMLPEEIEIKTLADLKEPFLAEENGKTFHENALIKARALYELVKAPVIADDSGLEVEALHGAPGIYSSRWLGEHTPYTIKNQALIDAVYGLRGSRNARYVCDLVFINEKGQEFVYEGIMRGEIAPQAAGSNGFGYDPVFYYPPLLQTNGQMEPEIKNRISHRAKAMQAFLRDQFNL